MEEGKATNNINSIAAAATLLATTPLFLEFFRMVFNGAHRRYRTSSQHSLPSPPTGEISLSDGLSQDITKGAGFV